MNLDLVRSIPGRAALCALLGFAAAACHDEPPGDLRPARPEGRDPAELFAQASATNAAGEREFPRDVLGFEPWSEGLPTAGTWIGYPLLADFNRDGLADLVASNREEDGYSAWRATVTGAWQHAIQGLPRDMQYGPADAGDADGDGDLDLYLAAHSNALKIYLNDGALVWQRGPSAIENKFLLLDIAVGNLDGDGKPDVAGIAHFEGGLALYLGDGEGGVRRLAEAEQVLPSKRTMGKAIELVDLDGDGTDDLLVACNQGLKAILVRPGETFRFEDISDGLPVPSIGNTIYSVTAGRFAPGDWPQIAACMLANPQDPPEARVYVGVWAYDPEARRWSAIDQGLPREEAYRELAAGDFDRDGKLDLITISIQSGAVIWLGAGDGSFRAAGRLEGRYGKGRIALGDVDGDGWLDVVVAVPADKANPEAGSVRCYRNKPEIWDETAGR